MPTIRPATPADVPAILRFIRELALYEREPDAAVATEADLLRDGFGPAPRFTALIVEQPTAAEKATAAEPLEAKGQPAEPAGFALYFRSYSTWLGHHGIRLEDLYVTPEHRGKGLGKALLARLARIAIDEGCPRLEWDVLAWNQPAIDVYEAVGAGTQTDWRIMRLAGAPLAALAAQSPM